MNSVTIHKKEGVVTNSKALDVFLDQLSNGSYELTAKGTKKRSNSQNSFWWGCVVPLVKDGLRAAGYNEVKTNEDAHEVLKALFLKRKIVSEIDANEIVIAGSTAKLTTFEFTVLIDEVAQWCSEYLGFVLPMPGEHSILFAEHDHEVNATIIT